MSEAHPEVTAHLARFILETKIEAIPENVRREGIRSLVIPANQWIDSCCPGAIPWARSS